MYMNDQNATKVLYFSNKTYAIFGKELLVPLIRDN